MLRSPGQVPVSQTSCSLYDGFVLTQGLEAPTSCLLQALVGPVSENPRVILSASWRPYALTRNSL